MKKLISLVLALILCIGLAACAGTDTGTTSSTSGSEAVPHSASGQMHNIGVLVYSLGDEQVIAFREYLENYIEGVFPDVNFIYSGAILDPDTQLRTMQSMIDAGVEGFMAFNSYDIKKEVDLCAENGVYYLRPSASISDEEYESVCDNEYFLGVIGPGSEEEYETGYAMGEYFANQEGADEYFILSGGAFMGNEMHLQRTIGILDAIQDKKGIKFDRTSQEIALSADMSHEDKDDVKVCVAPGYLDSPTFLEPVVAEYEEDQYQKVLGVLPVGEMAVSVNKAGAKLGVVDCYSTRNLQLFVDGTLSYVAGKYSSIIGPGFAAMYNAVTGYASDFRNPDGTAFRLKQGFWVSDSEEDFTDKYAFSSSIVVNAYNYEDLYNVCKVFNPDATLNDLETLALAYSYKDVLRRRE